jgi:FixJ family two-component response regulator
MSAEELNIKECDKMPLDKKQIYIVDDDDSVCRALRLLMITYGFAVDTFTSAEKFFSAVPNSAPGCLIMDIHLPGLNGWDALKELTESGSNRPVIIITANKVEGLNDRALKAGALGSLQKPFNDHELVDLINNG